MSTRTPSGSTDLSPSHSGPPGWLMLIGTAAAAAVGATAAVALAG